MYTAKTTALFLCLILLLPRLSFATPEDQQKKSERASNTAMFGAAMAFAGCAMLMAAAQGQSDPVRTMMMVQAMQQCAQGMQNADSGKKNKDRADKLAQKKDPPQTPPQLAANQNPQQATPSEPSSTPTPNEQPAESNAEEFKFQPPSTTTPNTSPQSTASVDLASEPVKTTSIPKGVEELRFNANAQKPSAQEVAEKNSPSGLSLFQRNLADEAKNAGVSPNPTSTKRQPASSGPAGEIADTSSSASAGTAGSEMGLDMLNQLFGSQGDGILGGGSADISFLPSSDETAGQSFTIFHLASQVYQRASFIDKRVNSHSAPRASISNTQSIVSR